MKEEIESRKIKVIAHIRSDFPTKFGIPRQSGLVPNRSKIVFNPEYRDREALRGIEGYDYIWLIWEFSEAVRDNWSPTVRPPRLGGNTRMGVFATRSPFRPNPIGLSSVKLIGLEETDEGVALIVEGADLMDGTPIYDIKPYVPYADSHPEARGGFTDPLGEKKIEVSFPEELLKKVPEEKRKSLLAVLGQDPRPSYQNDPERIYGMSFGGMEVKFKVAENILIVVAVE